MREPARNSTRADYAGARGNVVITDGTFRRRRGSRGKSGNGERRGEGGREYGEGEWE